MLVDAYGQPIALHPQIRPLLENAPPRTMDWGQLNRARNSHLPLSERLDAMEHLELFWKLELSAVDPLISDTVITRWLGEGTTSTLGTRLYTLLKARPQLLPYALNSDLSVASYAAASLHLSPSDATILMSRADKRTNNGRRIFRELALNPILPLSLRETAYAASTSHWPRYRKIGARSAFELILPVKSPTLSSQVLDFDTLVGLILWASGTAFESWDVQYNEGVKQAELDELLKLPDATRIARSLGVASKYYSTKPFMSGFLGIPLTVVSASPPVNCKGFSLLAAHAVWDVPLSHRWTRGYQPPAACETARLELGSDLPAWEAFAALLPDWSGTFGQLIETSHILSTD
jgi:hypothetical protein